MVLLPPSCRSLGCCLSLFLAALATLLLFWWKSSTEDSTASVLGGGAPLPQPSRDRDAVLHLLEQKGVYSETDYANEFDIVVPYWDTNPKTSRRVPAGTTTAQWGPCFAPHGRVRWDGLIEKYRHKSPEYGPSAGAKSPDAEDLANFCRPGFIIIGAGKCGTSVCVLSSFSFSSFS